VPSDASDSPSSGAKPPSAGAGSAIFLHCTDFARPTEGCVAIAREALIELLPRLTATDIVEIV